MAFQPPTAERRRQVSSIQTNPTPDHHDLYRESPASPAFPRQTRPYHPQQEEEEWVVFSPSVTVEPSNFTATEIGINDAGHSEFWTEEIGSGLSGTHDASYETETEEEGTVEEQREEYEEGEMENEGYEDSLGPFIEQQRQDPFLLPTHDGSGMFQPLTSQDDETVLMSGVASLQESLQLLAAHSKLFDHTNDVNSRIQKWRMEHSAAFMEEMEMARNRKAKSGTSVQSKEQRREELEASMMFDEEDNNENTTLGQQEEKSDIEVPETFWRRVTRSLMRDIMGIDDDVLEVIFGESLPPSENSPADTRINDETIGVSWERSLLERIARELGILIQHYTIHPTQGAFSTYPRWNASQIRNELETEGTKTPKPKEQPVAALSRSMVSTGPMDASTDIEFTPTLSNARPDSSYGRKMQFMGDDDQHNAETEARIEAQMRKEYWEQELGVKVFFSYLKSRFSSSSSHSNSPRTARKPPVTESHKSFYHQHPLIQRRGQQRRNGSVSSHSGQSYMVNSWGMLGFGGYRNGSSCASQSTKTNKRLSKGSQGNASAGIGGGATTAPTSSLSKGYYWEVESSVGSVGGGSCAGMGAWAEI